MNKDRDMKEFTANSESVQQSVMTRWAGAR